MKATEATRETLDLVHQYVEAAIGDCDPETLKRTFPGATIGTIASIYFHAINSEDWAIQELIRKTQKLFDSQRWHEKLGLPASASGDEIDWSKMDVPLPALQEYAQAVYKATDDWLNSVNDEDLDAQIPWGAGQSHNVAWVLADVIHSHLSFHAGEIAALKGLMGLKGLPW
jgi:hypothetical protein